MGIPTLISFLKKIRDSIQDGVKGVKKQVTAQAGAGFLAPPLLPAAHKLARPATEVVYYQVISIYDFYVGDIDILSHANSFTLTF